ncbi:hypothetical protein [Streptomyces sp. NPDC049906]|uniref:hypothetical protein n=1 Tax=Streptomyces sp. NPDC049906 TaxID=3155656 RepID=UPI00343D7742
MDRTPTAAQRRLIAAADPVTGRLRGTAARLAALGRLGLAFRHPRPPHDWFLTPAGRRWTLPQEPAPAPAAAPAPPAAVFAARIGGDAPDRGGARRAREVASAWTGLLELRRMTRTDGATDRPCAWERAHLVPAAALALEAAGCVPETGEGPGYRVVASAQPEAVGVYAADPAGLRSCTTALEGAGWQVSEHTEPRSHGRRHLLASPRRG